MSDHIQHLEDILEAQLVYHKLEHEVKSLGTVLQQEMSEEADIDKRKLIRNFKPVRVFDPVCLTAVNLELIPVDHRLDGAVGVETVEVFDYLLVS